MTESPSMMIRLLDRHATPLLLSALLLLLVVILVLADAPLITRIGISTLIAVVLVVGHFVFVGNSGILSFGQMGFSLIAAYGTAWLTMRPQMKEMMLAGLPDWLAAAQWPPALAMLASALLAAAVALLAGAVLMRLSGIAAAISTLAFAAIVNTVYANSDSVTGGVGALAGIPGGLSIWMVLGCAIFAIVTAHLFSTSATGLALKACREDAVAATACGINGFRVRLAAFVISAFLCGLAGSLQARFLGVISVDSFYLGATFLALTMLIIGGMQSLSGAVVGVLAISALMELLIRLEGASLPGTPLLVPPGTANFLIAVLMCVALVRRPAGLVGNRELTLASIRPLLRRIGKPETTK